MSSLIAGTIGYLFLNATLEGKPQKAEKPKSGKKWEKKQEQLTLEE